jgi:hypothetical protein
MAPTRPSAAPAADRGVDRARFPRGGGRLATVVHDFLLDPDQRLTEQERSLMTAMLLGLVGTVADEIRVRLPEEAAEACECDPAKFVDRLRSAGLLDQPALIALLLRRADEVRVAEALGGGALVVQRWTADEAPGLAAAAMAVVLARAAARDRFGRPGLELGDCDAETAVQLSYAVAAGLAAQAPDTEEALVAATVDLLGRHDEGQRLHALEARLVIALEAADRIDGGLLGDLAQSGEVGLLAQALARLAGVPADSAWGMLVGGDAGDVALLMRLSGQPRPVAARILAALAIPLGPVDPLTEIERFEELNDQEVATARMRLRHPPAFAAALNAIGRGDG